MPLTLPTFTINDPIKEKRILEAFKPTPESTMVEARNEYQSWLRRSLLLEVENRERANAVKNALGSLPSTGGLLDTTP